MNADELIQGLLLAGLVAFGLWLCYGLFGPLTTLVVVMVLIVAICES